MVFLSERESSKFFCLFDYTVSVFFLVVEISNYQERGLSPINQFNPTSFLCQSQKRPGFPFIYFMVFSMFNDLQ